MSSCAASSCICSPRASFVSVTSGFWPTADAPPYCRCASLPWVRFLCRWNQKPPPRNPTRFGVAPSMEEAAIEAKGLAPLRPHLDAIAAVHDKHDLARALGESLRADVDGLNDDFHTASLFGLWVAPGFNDPEHYAAYLLQGGLEMPDREYYVSDSESMRDFRTKYQTHVSALLKLAGFTDPDVHAQRVVELERAIAEKHIPLAD